MSFRKIKQMKGIQRAIRRELFVKLTLEWQEVREGSLEVIWRIVIPVRKESKS